jgi:hypothetical protein
LLRPLRLCFATGFARRHDALGHVFDLREDERRKVCGAGVLAGHGTDGSAVRRYLVEVYEYFCEQTRLPQRAVCGQSTRQSLSKKKLLALVLTWFPCVLCVKSR